MAEDIEDEGRPENPGAKGRARAAQARGNAGKGKGDEPKLTGQARATQASGKTEEERKAADESEEAARLQAERGNQGQIPPSPLGEGGEKQLGIGDVEEEPEK
jgi:hypothetical protein